MRPAVFLDRDGVINQNRADYVRTWEQVVFLPGVFDALRALADSAYAVVVVTNQSAIGRGIMTPEALRTIHDGIAARVAAEGGRFDGIYACPHRPDEGCDCRKPQPGMLLQAAARLDIDLAASYLVGDAVTDIEAALAAGARPIMVRTGRGVAQLAKLQAKGLEGIPVVEDLPEAVARILNGP
ncbi:MAG: D-glycero-beta-D-manno-heptose 1,7-bisphosphate 7-phosphatase [Caldilineales bacterium]